MKRDDHRSRLSRLRWLVLVMAGALVLAGCGGDDGDDDGGDRTAVIAEGDAICDVNYTELDAITQRVTRSLRTFEGSGTDRNREAVGDAIADFIENLEQTHSELSALEAPSDGEASFDGYLEKLGDQAEILGDARDAFLEDDLDRYDELGTEFTKVGREAKQDAAEYGFTICSASFFG